MAPRMETLPFVVVSSTSGHVVARVPRLEQHAGPSGGERDPAGEQQAGAHPAVEAGGLGEQRAEDGDRERATELAGGVEHSAGNTRLLARHAVEQYRSYRWHHQ